MAKLWIIRTRLFILVCLAVASAAIARPKNTTPAVVRHSTPTQPAAAEQASPALHRTMILMEITAYCADGHCCGSHACGITASGKSVSYNHGHFVAADVRLLPFGTELRIPGYAGGAAVPVIDKGGAIKGHKLDVFFPTEKLARQWGRKWLWVEVVSK